MMDKRKILPRKMGVLWVLGTIALVATLGLIYLLAFLPQKQTTVGTPPPPPGDDWPTYLHDNERTAHSKDILLSPENAARLGRLWVFKTGAGIAAGPTVVKGTVYIGSWDGNEYALDANTGFLKWKRYLGKTEGHCDPALIGITSSATVQDDVVYVGGGDSYWYALDAFTGAVLWRVDTGDNHPDKGFYNWSSPLLYKDFAYIGIASNCDNPLVQGKLLKVSLKTHQVVGSVSFVNDREVGGGIWTTPTLDRESNTIFVTTGTQNQPWQNLAQAIAAVDVDTMKLKSSWQIPPSQSGGDYDWGNTPVLITDAQGRKLVAATNKNGFTYAFKREDVAAGPVWEQQTGLGGMCPPCGEGSVSSGTFADNTLFMAGGNTVINGTGYPGALRAIDPSTGKNKWEHGVPNPIIPAIAYANGLVIDGEGQTIEILDAKTGARLYSYETGATLYGPPAISHGQIFMGSLDGNVYAFGLRAMQDQGIDCTQGWSCTDIGNPKTKGSANLIGSTWEIKGSGTGLADVSDQFHYVQRPWSGDGELMAHIAKLPEAGMHAGIMMRQNLERGSPFYAVAFTPTGSVIAQYRTAFNGGITTSNEFSLPGHPRFTAIQRVGDRFQAAVSADGLTYTLVPGSMVSLVLPTKLASGLYVSAGANASSIRFVEQYLGKLRSKPEAPESASACPEGWQCADVGNPGLVGNQLITNNLWTVQGEGKDIWATHDQFHYVWQTFPNNSTLTAHLNQQESTDALAKAGLMLRTNTQSDAPYYAAFFTPGGGLTVQARLVQGLNSTIVTSNPVIKAPHYLRIARWKNIFTTYVSPDNKRWTALGGSSLTLDVGGEMLGGVVVTSHKKDQMSDANFDSVSTEQDAPAAPTACPEQWNCTDVGYPAPKGTQIFDTNNKIWTLQGGGFDIFFKQDQFHYVWRETIGDSTISARVSYVAGGEVIGNDYAKAGVMMREKTEADSPYYGAFLTPEHGVMVQYRRQKGEGTGEALLPTIVKGALYLKVERVGNLYTAYVSKDSVSWVAVDGSQVEINTGDTMLMGLAVTSHNPAAVREVTFNDLNLS